MEKRIQNLDASIKEKLSTIAELKSKGKSYSSHTKDLKQMINKKRTYQYHLEKLRESEMNIANALVKKSNAAIESIKKGIEKDTIEMVEMCKDDHELYFDVLMELLKSRIKKGPPQDYTKEDEELFTKKGVNEILIEFNEYRERDINEEFSKIVWD